MLHVMSSSLFKDTDTNLVLCHAHVWVDYTPNDFYSLKRDRNIVNTSIHPSITISPPKLLAEFNQICYITSPHGKGVWEQHYISVPQSVHLSSVHRLSGAWHFVERQLVDRSLCPQMLVECPFRRITIWSTFFSVVQQMVESCLH